MPSFFPNNEFATNDKIENRDNNAITIIEELFLNIRYKLLYKTLTEKMV